MRSSGFTSSRSETARFAFPALLAAALGLAACSGGPESDPLVHATVKVQSITQSGSCEDTNVKATPVELKANPPKLANTKELIIPVKLTKAADGVACTGTGSSIPMAPGKWKFSVMLPSDIVTCEHDVAMGSEPIAFKDGEQGCGGPPAAATADAPAPAPTAPAAPASPPAGGATR